MSTAAPDVTERAPRIRMALFAGIGMVNTLFDVALYTALRSAGNGVVTANLISASAALVGSYLLNSKLTFRARRWSLASFAAFVGVTLFGLWVLQTGAIYGFSHLLHHVPARVLRHLGPFQPLALTAGPKLLATGVTVGWNYLWYHHVVFRPPAVPPVPHNE